jgi:hypothetical protein
MHLHLVTIVAEKLGQLEHLDQTLSLFGGNSAVDGGKLDGAGSRSTVVDGDGLLQVEPGGLGILTDNGGAEVDRRSRTLVAAEVAVGAMLNSWGMLTTLMRNLMRSLRSCF